MYITTKVLLSFIITLITVSIITVTWVITPQHSGVAFSVGLVGLIVGGLLIAWVFESEPAC